MAKAQFHNQGNVHDITIECGGGGRVAMPMWRLLLPSMTRALYIFAGKFLMLCWLIGSCII
jgi:hypothetical protein